MEKSRGFRSRTRKKLSKKARMRGKVTLTKMLQTFDIGERVIIKHEPAIHKGMPHPRYKNKVGVIIGKQGKVYKIKISDNGKVKCLLAHPVHLEKK